MSLLPSLFISHGAPDLGLHDLPVRRFLDALPDALPRPKAILVASAHYEAPAPRVTAAEHPRTIHDFGGFDPRLYTMQYPAPGAPALAQQVVELLAEGGLEASLDADWGFDHGAWVPLIRMFPAADLPVLEVSVQGRAGAAFHVALGRALGALRARGVLVVGSGALTHNLQEIQGPPANDAAPAWVDEFADWFGERLAAGDDDALADYRARAPHARRNHPSEEHLMPFFVALGAAGERWRATRLHRSVTYRALRMDAYRFDSDP